MLGAIPEQTPGPESLHTVAVIGAGIRGRAFALLCAHAGLTVLLEDVLSSNLRKAAEELAAGPAGQRGRVHLVNSVEDAVREADLAIDFVPDELESKLEIFSMMDRMAPPRTLFCTPTALSIADLASCTYRADRCIGIVPFGEELGTQLTLVRGPATGQGPLEAAKALFEGLGVSVQTTEDQASGSALVR